MPLIVEAPQYLGSSDSVAIFAGDDAYKLRSSPTSFEAARGKPLLAAGTASHQRKPVSRFLRSHFDSIRIRHSTQSLDETAIFAHPPRDLIEMQIGFVETGDAAEPLPVGYGDDPLRPTDQPFARQEISAAPRPESDGQPDPRRCLPSGVASTAPDREEIGIGAVAQRGAVISSGTLAMWLRLVRVLRVIPLSSIAPSA